MPPYVQESKKLRALIINKDERKSLARKNGNENPIWSWNDSIRSTSLPASGTSRAPITTRFWLIWPGT